MLDGCKPSGFDGVGVRVSDKSWDAEEIIGSSLRSEAVAGGGM